MKRRSCVDIRLTDTGKERPGGVRGPWDKRRGGNTQPPALKAPELRGRGLWNKVAPCIAGKRETVSLLLEAAYCSLGLPIPAVTSRVAPTNPQGVKPPLMSQAEGAPPSPLFNS